MVAVKNRNYIQAIKQALEENNIQVQKGLTPSRAVIRTMNSVFQLIPDPRKTVDDNDYPLYAILGSAFLAVLSDCNDWMQIEDYVSAKRNWLARFYPCFRKKHNFQNRISEMSRYTPSHDTYRRIFGLIPMHEFQTTLRDFLKESINTLASTLHVCAEFRIHYAIDGKVERGTGREFSATAGGKVPDIQTLNIYNSTYGVTEYSFPIDSKRNEIPIAQRALGRLELHHAIVTADPLHTQTKTCRLIHDGGGDYILGVKGNQPGMKDTMGDVFGDMEVLGSLLDDELFTSTQKGKVCKAHKYYRKTVEKAHGQVETREIYMVPLKKLAKPLADSLREKWAGLESLVCLDKTIEPTDGSETKQEVRYYISSLTDIDEIFAYIRIHWAIEAHHFDLDYTFASDDNQTMDRVAVQNFSFFAKVVRTILEYLKLLLPKYSLRRIRKIMGYDDENIGILSLLIGNAEAMKNFKAAYKKSHSKKMLENLVKLYEECCNL